MWRAVLLGVAILIPAAVRGDDRPVEIGQRRELFVEHSLVERLNGEATWRLQHPVPREVVLSHDAPWEGSGCGYHSLFQDGDLYRLYYKSYHLQIRQGKLIANSHPLYCCYAESPDGIHWKKPALGLVEFQGSRSNNILIKSGPVGALKVDAGHPAIFKDDNPDATPQGRYKGLLRSDGAIGLIPYQSPDGIHWEPMAQAPVITDGAFDSQNLAFWDSDRKEYRAYWRYFTAGVTTEKEWKPQGIRAIRTARSHDFLHWTDQRDLEYVDSPPEQLYTNQVKPYHRAPHLVIGFPSRYVDRGWSDSMQALPDREHREQRAGAVTRYGTAVTEALVMASRDRVKFQRWNEAFLPPGPERPGSWNYGQQYLAWHVVETPSSLPGAAPELSLYATENYWRESGSVLRRYTLRLDGFVSAYAPSVGGELLTKPLRFRGQQLHLNFSSSAAGGIRVEIQNGEGQAIPGFSLAESQVVFGDAVERPVSWKQGTDVSSLAGQTIRLRFELRDAHLFAYQFREMPDSKKH